METTTAAPAGSWTAVPRWTRTPRPGAAEHTETLSDRECAALRRTAGELGAPPAAVLFAAHLRVLAALTGEREITTGYAGGAAFRVPVADDREELVRAARRAPRALPASEPDVVFDPGGAAGAPPGSPALRVGVEAAGPAYTLRLRYRTDVLDAAAAARIAGYHRAALAALTAGPGAPEAGRGLVSAAEVRYQSERLAGPVRPLPDRRAHELFEERAAARPDAVAAEHAGRRWTFRELEARANRLAHALLDAGLRPQEPVAVIRERDLEWMASVLAVLKAGGAYLPVEPHFPAARISRMLARACVRLVLTGSGPSALPGPRGALAALPGAAVLDAA
ncbi:AMP-binding protein, partial [Streptomyces sp. ODS05-4]|uniref:AMP-binding protein n=1 Tax=Streptomyces sp. ODS05-4 TaxID=2944939 RepID=UPI00210EF8DC